MSHCLILVDLQKDYFSGGKMELVGIEEAAARANTLLEEFRKKKYPVIHIQHVSNRPSATFFLPNTEGVRIHPMMEPQNNEIVVTKNYPNSFRETSLLEKLKEKGATGVVVCGAMSHMCIDATVRAAFDFGFQCRVANDACATRDLIYQNRVIKASDVHASFMAALAVPYAEVIPAKAIIKSLG
jgi:nicotinamidase-related amidase